MNKNRGLYIGVVPVTNDLEIDSDNVTQVKNFVALADLSLKDLKFLLLNNMVNSRGEIDLSINLSLMDFDTEDFIETVEMVKIIMKGNLEYDNNTTAPDIVRKYRTMISQSDIDVSNYTEEQWIALTKLIIIGGKAGEEFVDNIDMDFIDTNVPIYLMLNMDTDTINEVSVHIKDYSMHLGYIIYSAIMNEFENEYDQLELDEMSDISLKALKFGTRIIASVPSDIDISTEIKKEISNEYINNLEIPAGYKLN